MGGGRTVSLGRLVVPGGRCCALRCGEAKEGDETPYLSRREGAALVQIGERSGPGLRPFGCHAAALRVAMASAYASRR